MSEFQKLTSAMEKRQDFKTKSTPPSLEKAKITPSLAFSVLKPTPKIIEPKDTEEKADGAEKIPDNDSLKNDSDNSPSAKDKSDSVEDTVTSGETASDDVTSESLYERTSQSPERLLDSSTDSVPPSESSMESSQTCTSSLESSSHSPPLEESSLSSERVSYF